MNLSQTEVKKTELEELSAPPRPSLVISASSNWAPLVVNIIIGFLLTPYLISHLGMKNFGIWAMVGSFVGYYGLLRLGIGAGIMRYVPFYVGRDDHKSASQIVSSGMALFLLVGLVIFAISMLMAKPIARFYKAGPDLAALVRILGVAAAVECPLRILDASVKAQERWVAANFVTIASAVSRALGLAGCIYLGYGLVQMGYVILAVTAFSMILMSIIFMKFCPLIHLRVSMIKLYSIRHLIFFGLLTLVATLVYSLCLDGHKLIIGKLISLEAVCIYAVAALIMRYVRAAVVAPNRVLWPRFALLDGENNHRKVRHLFLQGTQYNSIFASGMILIVLAAGPSFIRLWVGEGFETVSSLLVILSAGYLVETSLVACASLLGGTGRQMAQAIFAAIEGLLGFTLSILLGWKMGLVGVALGFTIPVILIRGLVRTWYICHYLDISMFRYYVGCLLRPWGILGLLAVLVYHTKIVKYVHNWPSLIIFVITLGCLYILCAYSIAMSDDDKKNVQSYIRKLSMRTLILIGIKK